MPTTPNFLPTKDGTKAMKDDKTGKKGLIERIKERDRPDDALKVE